MHCFFYLKHDCEQTSFTILLFIYHIHHFSGPKPASFAFNRIISLYLYYCFIIALLKSK
jgi:hypothetical protein